jgi:hypothetical protein
MNIAIIGAGNVGSALAKAWTARGHKVRLGIHDQHDQKIAPLLASLGPSASAHTNAAAAQGSDVVVLATPWPAAKAAIESCGPLQSKIIIDCTNPLRPDLSDLEIGHTTSAGEMVAAWAKGACVFKAFNTTGSANMADQSGYSHKLVMFVAGDDAASKPKVMQLATDAGFEAIDVGPLLAARWLEPLAMLWVHLAVKMGMGAGLGLALVRR